MIFDKISCLFSNKSNDDLLDAIIAACAIVVFADGNIEDEEKIKFQNILKENEFINSLKDIDNNKVIITFNNYLETLKNTYFIGIVKLVDKIKKIEDNESKKLLVKLCYLIKHKDDKNYECEEIAIKELCIILNIDIPQLHDLIVFTESIEEKADKLISTTSIMDFKLEDIGSLNKYITKAVPMIALLLLKYVGSSVVNLIDDDKLIKPSLTFAYQCVPAPFGIVLRSYINPEDFCSYMLKNRDLLKEIIMGYVEENKKENINH